VPLIIRISVLAHVKGEVADTAAGDVNDPLIEFVYAPNVVVLSIIVLPK